MNASRLYAAMFCGYALTSCLAISARSETTEADVACRVSGRAIQKFAACVFPMDFQGTKKIEVEMLGVSVKKDISWRARVSNPTITITANRQTFTADVKATADGLPWKGKVDGRLDITYSPDQKAIVVAVREAIVPIRAGPIALDVDVSDEIPELPFVLPMPELIFPFDGERIQVITDPVLEFQEGEVVVVTDTTFERR